MLKTSLLTLMVLLNACAFVHRHQVNNVDARILKADSRKFEFMLSETGVEIAEGAGILGAMARHGKSSRDGGRLAELILAFQMGPRTGNPIYRLNFTDELHTRLHQICPQGEDATGLTFLRETNKYPVVSGEIIKVSGYCIKRKRS